MAKSIKRNNAKYNCQAQSTFHTYTYGSSADQILFFGGGGVFIEHYSFYLFFSLFLCFFFFLLYCFFVFVFLFLKIQAPYDTVRNPHLCSTSYNIGDNRTFWPLVCDDAS